MHTNINRNIHNDTNMYTHSHTNIMLEKQRGRFRHTDMHIQNLEIDT